MAITKMRLKDEAEHGPETRASKLPPIVLKEVYEQRFSREDQAGKEAIWRELGPFLQRYIKDEANAVDLPCDLWSFIRNVRAGELWATDIRDMRASLPKEVRFVPANGLDLDEALPNNYFDVAFF